VDALSRRGAAGFRAQHSNENCGQSRLELSKREFFQQKAVSDRQVHHRADCRQSSSGLDLACQNNALFSSWPDFLHRPIRPTLIYQQRAHEPDAIAYSVFGVRRAPSPDNARYRVVSEKVQGHHLPTNSIRQRLRQAAPSPISVAKSTLPVLRCALSSVGSISPSSAGAHASHSEPRKARELPTDTHAAMR